MKWIKCVHVPVIHYDVTSCIGMHRRVEGSDGRGDERVAADDDDRGQVPEGSLLLSLHLHQLSQPHRRDEGHPRLQRCRSPVRGTRRRCHLPSHLTVPAWRWLNWVVFCHCFPFPLYLIASIFLFHLWQWLISLYILFHYILSLFSSRQFIRRRRRLWNRTKLCYRTVASCLPPLSFMSSSPSTGTSFRNTFTIT